MPNPPFQPLTLSVEEWQRMRIGHDADHAALVKECEAQAQAAASLRQRLEDWHKVADDRSAEIVRLKAQLEQAQQERDAYEKSRDHYDLERRESYQAMCGWKGRAEQAEAALTELQKPEYAAAVLTAIMACDHCAMEGRKVGDPAYFLGWEIAATNLKLLAELQRRRSAPGQEKT